MLLPCWSLSDRAGLVLLAVLVILGVGVPVPNLLVPANHPLHLSAYTVTVLGKYLCYALLAVAIDLGWGYMGILSLGHAAFLPWAAIASVCI